jgi:hypothetical protein
MAYFFNLLPDRAEQLEREKRIDEKLEPYLSICPEAIAAYYAALRRINREQFENVEKAGIFEVYSVIKKQMEINGHHQEDVLGRFGQRCDPCDFLKHTIPQDNVYN